MEQYVITDGARYIYKNRQNKFVPISNETMADSFTLKQAQGILNNSLPKPMRKIFYVKSIEPRTSSPVANSAKPVNKITSFVVKHVSKKELEENVEKMEEADNIQYWVNKILDLNGLAQEAGTRKEKLVLELKDIENEILDCLHYIEFCNLNAAQGYIAYKMLKNMRIKRRAIKNELEILNPIIKNTIGKAAVKKVEQIIKTMDQRTYNPRKLIELFDL